MNAEMGIEVEIDGFSVGLAEFGALIQIFL